MPALYYGDGLEIENMAKFDPSQNQNPSTDCQKIVMGDQVGEETKFGADQSTRVFRGDMPIFNYHSIISFYTYIQATIALRGAPCHGSEPAVGFYHAAYMQAVLPIAKVSVCLSVCHSVNCDKTNESSAEILIPHES